MSQDKNSNVAIKEFIGGCISGFSKIYTGQPFDIVKVRLQSYQGANKPSVLSVLMNIIKNEGGVFALWKGSLPPLIGVGATVAIQFGVNENVKRLLLKANGGQRMSFKELFVSGWVAGFANCVVSTPAEHFRIRMQTQSKQNPVYNGSIDCMKKIFKNQGIKGVFRGVTPTIGRDSFGYGVYFALYSRLMDMFAPGQTRRDYNLAKVFTAGSIAGIMFWVLVFPFDIVKTRFQTDNFANPQYKSTIGCFRQIYSSKGLGGFYQGFLPCLLRAVPVNGAVFMFYELLFRTWINPAPKAMNIA